MLLNDTLHVPSLCEIQLSIFKLFTFVFCFLLVQPQTDQHAHNTTKAEHVDL